MGNPNPALITGATWALWEGMHALEPDTMLGGIYADKSGYHNTRNANKATNYSVREWPDKAGPGDKAAAIDWTFPEAHRGNYRRIALYSLRLLASGRDAHDPRLDSLREFYGNTDSDREVEGWDFRQDKAVSSDRSHLWHVHISITRGRVADPAMTRAVLSVLKGETVAQWLAAEAGQPLPPEPPAPPRPWEHFPVWPGVHLRKGMNNARVTLWQRLLDVRGWSLRVDGDFGDATDRITRAFQRQQLGARRADGIVGPVTWSVARTRPV
jgi:peptidoglycan hydrolase-like protein with peptidoglycan-binding domain